MNITTDIQQPYLVVDIVLVIITKSKQSSTHAGYVYTIYRWLDGGALVRPTRQRGNLLFNLLS